MLISDLLKVIESQQKIIDALVDIADGARADFQHLNSPKVGAGVRCWALQSLARIDKAGAQLPFNESDGIVAKVRASLLKCRWCLKDIEPSEEYSALHDACWGEESAE